MLERMVVKKVAKVYDNISKINHSVIDHFADSISRASDEESIVPGI